MGHTKGRKQENLYVAPSSEILRHRGHLASGQDTTGLRQLGILFCNVWRYGQGTGHMHLPSKKDTLIQYNIISRICNVVCKFLN